MIHHNFTAAQELEVAIVSSENTGSNVTLLQSAGSMHFQFSMRPDAARAFAADVIAHAERVEAMEAGAAA